MPETDSKFIFTGFWTDESTPGVLGSTWTMEQQYANFVVALVAILVSIGVNSAWSLLLFVVHQSRATAVPKDGLFRQQQILLRSLGSPGSISLDFLKIAQAWSGFSSKAYLRCLVWMIVGLVFATGGLVAGVISSEIVSLTDLRVLVKSPSCQQLNMTEYLSAPSILTVGLDTEVHNVAIAYADQCYGTWKAPSQCNSYVRPRISFDSSFGHSPFDRLLDGNIDRALTLDSGYLDSNDVFGINARPRDRVEIRRKATCSPLESVSYTTVIDPELDPRPFRTSIGRESIPGERLYTTHYGVGKFGLDAVYNATDVRSTLLSNITSRYYPTAVRAYSSADLSPFNSAILIDDLKKIDADVTLVVIYTGATTSLLPIDGPIYSAHTELSHTDSQNVNTKVFRADQPLGVIGCIEQYEYCLPVQSGHRKRICTQASGSQDRGFERLLPSANQRQLATLQLLGAATAYTGLVNPANNGVLNSSAAYGANDWLSGLPPDQWAFDIQSMEAVVLAELQVFVAMHAQGYQENDGDQSFVRRPAFHERGEDWLCHSQKVVKLSGFANINVFGFSFIMATTLLLVSFDYGVIRTCVHYHTRIGRYLPNIRFWIEDDLFQLQRAAYDAKGLGLWSRLDKDVPIVENGALLENLNPLRAQ